MCWSAGAPVVPVAIRGTFALLPKTTLAPRPGPVDVCIGEPIDVSAYNEARVTELVTRTRAAIESASFLRCLGPRCSRRRTCGRTGQKRNDLDARRGRECGGVDTNGSACAVRSRERSVLTNTRAGANRFNCTTGAVCGQIWTMLHIGALARGATSPSNPLAGARRTRRDEGAYGHSTDEQRSSAGMHRRSNAAGPLATDS